MLVLLGMLVYALNILSIVLRVVLSLIYDPLENNLAINIYCVYTVYVIKYILSTL